MRAAVDIAFSFTTDPELASADYVALRDDRHVFPPFRVTLLFDRRKLARLGPDARRVVAQVQEQLTTKVVRKLKRRVTFDGKKPARVAAEFLRETGLVK
jgi:osmoprotectant transport system substrate-binding protein